MGNNRHSSGTLALIQPNGASTRNETNRLVPAHTVKTLSPTKQHENTGRVCVLRLSNLPYTRSTTVHSTAQEVCFPVMNPRLVTQRMELATGHRRQGCRPSLSPILETGKTEGFLETTERKRCWPRQDRALFSVDAGDSRVHYDRLLALAAPD